MIEITVTEALDETDYLLSTEKDRDQLQQSMQSLEQGKGITFSVQELQEKYGTK